MSANAMRIDVVELIELLADSVAGPVERSEA
jgi:hypothetical protein